MNYNTPPTRSVFGRNCNKQTQTKIDIMEGVTQTTESLLKLSISLISQWVSLVCLLYTSQCSRQSIVKRGVLLSKISSMCSRGTQKKPTHYHLNMCDYFCSQLLSFLTRYLRNNYSSLGTFSISSSFFFADFRVHVVRHYNVSRSLLVRFNKKKTHFLLFESNVYLFSS